MRTIPIKAAESICGSLTHTNKMPCASYDLPVEACRTGFKLAKIPGTICADCYAAKGNYKRFEANIKPAQFARLDALEVAMQGDGAAWIESITTLISNARFFRWFSSGDLQGLKHLILIAEVCRQTPNTRHWLATREVGIVKQFAAAHKIPPNLIIRLSATRPDEAAKIPESLRGFRNITTSNAHTLTPIGKACPAPDQGNQCHDCRACWGRGVVSYRMH
jgi:hypothetical protein